MRSPGNNISSIFGKLIRIKFLLNNCILFLIIDLMFIVKTYNKKIAIKIKIKTMATDI
jgi:hypothetical protein